MDFSNRSAQSSSPASSNQPARRSESQSKSGDSKLARVGIVTAVVAVAILLLGIAVYAGKGGNRVDEYKYVNTSKLQAVFLNTGQVYFGNIRSLTNNNIVLSNIYYLQTANNGNNASANTNTNVSLVKLGCELHEPFDQMVINRDQVTFWENLQDNGQVAKAVTTFKQQNPQGLKCSDQSSSASTNSVNSTQNAGSTNKANP